MRKLTVVFTLLMVLALTSGCTRTQQGALIGGGIGAGTAAIWVHNSSGKLSDAEGTLIGMAAGGLAGALVGDMLDEVETNKEKADLNQQISDLNSKLADKDKTIDDLKREIDQLKKDLANRPEVKVDESKGKIRFTILNEVLFDSGKDKLKPEGKQVIDAVADIVKQRYADREVNVEGHTDADPIKVSGWKTNWELSAARSLAVVHYLIGNGKVAPEKMSGQAFSQYRSIASNETPEGKAQNRRAVIVVMPAEGKVVKERSE